MAMKIRLTNIKISGISDNILIIRSNKDKTMFNEDETSIKNMIEGVAKAINQSMADSEEIQNVLDNIKAQGYGVDLLLAACIGIYKENKDETEREENLEPISVELNQDDRAFLKTLNIKPYE